MFTGIVTDVGGVRAVSVAGDTRFEIATTYDTSGIAIGASIACSGACLSVVEKGAGWFAVQASAETLGCTTLGDWRPGTRVNLERALKIGDELGGHIVSGHVDGVARLASRRPEGASVRLEFVLAPDLMGFVASKGSITIDGVSLTVNEVTGDRFGVNIIPHTALATTLGDISDGDSVNVEIDMLARYVARLLQKE
ncbi:MAG: riboflavin synthase [Alphaproteobacteria bacterium]|nr:riboflavin synthase [Alphaproteobacteria bacterium]